MLSKGNNSIISCGKLAAGFTFKDVRMVTLTNLTFIGCGKDSRLKAVLQISQVIHANITTCTFLHSKGRVIEAVHINMSTRNCSFKHSSAGVITAEYNVTMFDTGSIYINNTFSTKKSALLYIHASNANFTACTFRENFETPNIIHVKGATLTIKRCELAHNKAGLVTSFNSTVNISGSNFIDNHALLLVNATVNRILLALLNVKKSNVVSHDNLIITNNMFYSSIRIYDSEVEFGIFRYFGNMGCVRFIRSKVAFSERSEFQNNRYGCTGIVTSISSIIHFYRTTNFNNLYSGRAISATESRIYAHDGASFFNNKATSSGGALYLDQSNFICQKSCTFTNNTASKGGAIYAINSIITIGRDWNKFKQNENKNSSLHFISNSAKKGGAVYLTGNSRLRAPRGKGCNYLLEFNNNTANLGGAVFVNDYSNTCKHSTCFIQAPSIFPYRWNGWIKIKSTNGNTTIYGGLLDRCKANNREIPIFLKDDGMVGINYIKRVTNDMNIEDQISSDAVRVCYCEDKKVNCSKSQTEVTYNRGETFNVSVAAVDQVSNTLDALILINSNQRHSLGIGQGAQTIHKGCSNLSLQVLSPNNEIKFTIYAKGPCNDVGISKVVLNVKFKSCNCPIGFQPQKSPEDCMCDCDPQIKHLIKKCDHSSGSLLREGDFWINYINNTNTTHFLTFPHCPYDYCIPAVHSKYINLNIPNGADAQCALNRTGLLCSSCKAGLSLSLGSSRCLQCPNDWQKLFIVITMGAMASGIVLVMVILVLNMTTAVGTLNGLIFYANIVASNNITFHYMSKTKVFSVFIALLNLDLGLDTCFFNGLDSYSKAWLQLIFPAFLITVLIMVILMSKYSSRFAKLIGKRNPIATLATVILLSYMKLLRNINHIFSVAVLRYPDGLQKRWLPDANIEYLQGKHIPLFLLGVTIVFIGLIYTILLLSWQWLLRAPHYKCLGWIRNTRLNLFMEANLAAYNSKHRYWTGLLLLIRVALYLEIAVDTSDRKSNSLVATGIVCTCLLFIKALSGSPVYKNKLVDYFNSICYMNLLLLSIVYGKGKVTAVNISVSIAMVQLLCVLTYHAITTLFEIPYLRTSLAQRLQKYSKLGKLFPVDPQEMDIAMDTMSTSTTPTSTEIGLRDSKDASAAEVTQQPLTTTWEESDSLREPLIQELNA